MKIISLIILFISNLVLSETSAAKTGADVALKFMNDYAAFCENDTISLTDKEWVEQNPLVSKNFKTAHKKILYDTERSEEGLGVDPIFDSQDYPDSGFIFLSADDNAEYVTLKGKDWSEFNVVVKVIQIGKRWLVDGAGIVNVPENKRAKR